ncbi:MAG: crotonase/enoyl-CoA hydratase family protein [Rhizobiaceae bacterium]|nr:crotonase/enoyl-CoA hydratase family protein [Rhizobiaceae bacterium]
MSDHITTELHGAVQVIRMNRPDKKNALTAQMYGQMSDGLISAFENDAVGAVLILGCPGVFSAGNDIGDFMKIAMSGDRSSMQVFDFLEQIIMAKKPVIAGVDGLAIGIGTTMLLHCDHVIASEQATFKTPFVDLGLVPEAGSSLFAPRLMGHHRAFELLAMGEKFSPQAAQDAGFVNAIVTPDKLEQTALDVAADIASKPPQAMEVTRKLIRGDRSDILARMKEEAVLFGERLASDEAKQAFMAFMSKGK